MAYLNQPWFNRQIVNRFTMATGIVHSQTLIVMNRFSKQPQKIPVTPGVGALFLDAQWDSGAGCSTLSLDAVRIF